MWDTFYVETSHFVPVRDFLGFRSISFPQRTSDGLKYEICGRRYDGTSGQVAQWDYNLTCRALTFV
jgi:hypothetical protein